MSRLIIYAGPNGAGKSTLRDIGDDPVDTVIDPDRIAREICPANPGSVQVEAGRTAILQFQACIATGKSMSLETTLTGNTVLKRMEHAKSAGFDVTLRYVALETALMHVGRVEERVRNGGHHIPRETILRRYENSLDNLLNAVRLAERITIMDNSGREKQILLRVDHGTILQQAAHAPEWFMTRLPDIIRAIGGKHT